MKKTISLAISIIMAFGLITIPASAAQPVAGDTAEQLYANYQGYLVSDMPGNGYGNYAPLPHSPQGLYALIDGITNTWAGTVLPTSNFEFPYHIEMGFGCEWLTGECIMDFTGISIGCIQGAWQGITLFDLEALDLLTGQWKPILKDVEITWENDDNTYMQKQFNFPTTVRSSRLRLVIRDATIFYNGSYYHFRIDELRMYGTYTGLNVQNLMKFNTSIQEKDINGNIKSGGFGPVRTGQLSQLYDDRYDTTASSFGYGYIPSDDSQFPAVLEITLDKKYWVTGFDVAVEDWPWHTSNFSKRFVDNVSLYYSVDGGGWQQLVSNYTIDWQQSISRARSGQNDRMPKLAPIYIDEAVIADKIKLVIHKPSEFSTAADGLFMTEFIIRGMEYFPSFLKLRATQHWGAVTNLSEETQSGVFIMALYSAGNELKDIAIRNFTLEPGKSNTYDSSIFSKTVSSDDYVKVFAFDSMNSIEPLALNKDSREPDLD